MSIYILRTVIGRYINSFDNEIDTEEENEFFVEEEQWFNPQVFNYKNIFSKKV